MSVNEILKTASPLIVALEFTAPPTNSLGEDLPDMCGGDWAHGEIDDDTIEPYDGHLILTDGYIPDVNHNMVLKGNTQYERQLSTPFSGSKSSASFSTLSCEIDENLLNLSARDLIGLPFEQKVGGVVNRGAADEEQLAYADYETWIQGRFEVPKIGSTVDFSVTPTNQEFLNKIPPNVFDTGESKGSAMPVIVGRVNGFSPPPEGDGIYRFTSDGVNTLDDLQDSIPYAYFGDGLSIMPNLAFDDADDGTISTFDNLDFEWETSGSDLFSDDSIEVTVSSSGGKTSLSPSSNQDVDGNEFVIERTDSTGVKTYGRGDMKWRESSGGLISAGELPVQVELNGDHYVSSIDVAGRWFKVLSPTSSKEEIKVKFQRNVVGLKIVARNVQPTTTNITDYSKNPDSVSPEFDAGVDSIIRYENLNSTELTFEYKASNTENLAFWIQEVTYAEQNQTDITFDFETDIDSIELEIESNGGVYASGWSAPVASETGTMGDGVATVSLTGLTSDRVKFTLDMGTDDVKIRVNEVVSDDYEYGSFRIGDELELRPEASKHIAVINYQLESDLIDSDSVFTTTIEARVAGPDACYMTLRGGEAYYNLCTLSNAFQTFTFQHTQSVNGIVVETWAVNRTITMESGADTLFNPGSPFKVKIRKIETTLLTPVETDIYCRDPSTKEHINTFYISDVRDYPHLPKGYAVYDPDGRVRQSEDYPSCEGTFNGKSRNMPLAQTFDYVSELALGREAIDINGDDLAYSLYNSVNFVLTQQQDFNVWLGGFLSSIDWIGVENEQTNTIDVSRRGNGKDNGVILHREMWQGERVEKTGIIKSESQYVIKYDVDLTNPDYTKQAKSKIYPNDKDPREIVTPLAGGFTPAEIADISKRDSRKIETFTGVLYDIGHGLSLNEKVWPVATNHPAGKPAIITNLVERLGSDVTEVEYWVRYD